MPRAQLIYTLDAAILNAAMDMFKNFEHTDGLNYDSFWRQGVRAVRAAVRRGDVAEARYAAQLCRLMIAQWARFGFRPFRVEA